MTYRYPLNTETITVEYVERILKQEHFNSDCILPLDAFNMKFEVNQFAREMFMRLQYRVYAEDMGRVEKKVHIEVYQTWWDHFKATYAPKWFKKWFPVCTRLETRTIGITSKALYPKFRPMKDQDVVIVREITCPGVYK